MDAKDLENNDFDTSKLPKWATVESQGRYLIYLYCESDVAFHEIDELVDCGLLPFSKSLAREKTGYYVEAYKLEAVGALNGVTQCLK